MKQLETAVLLWENWWKPQMGKSSGGKRVRKMSERREREREREREKAHGETDQE